MGGYSGSFEIAVPINRPIVIRIFNELNCQAEIPTSLFPEVFTEDVHVGDITNLIEFDRLSEVSFDLPDVPACLQDPQLIINGGEYDKENISSVFACEASQVLEYQLIDYESMMSSNIEVASEEGLSFTCQPYEFEFEVKTGFGTFNQDSETIEVRSLHYSQHALVQGPVPYSEVLYFDVALNGIWSCTFLIGLFDPEVVSGEFDFYSFDLFASRANTVLSLIHI